MDDDGDGGGDDNNDSEGGLWLFQTCLLMLSRSAVTLNLIHVAVNRPRLTSLVVPKCVLTGQLLH